MYYLQLLPIYTKFESFLQWYLDALAVADMNFFCSKTLENGDFTNLDVV